MSEMIEPARASRKPAAAPAAVEAGGSAAGWIAAAAFIALGVALRWLLARHAGTAVAEWEADDIVRLWERLPWHGWNRTLPRGHEALLGRLGDALGGAPTIEAARLAGIGLSVAALVAAMVTMSLLAAGTRAPRRATGRAAAWMSAIWCAHPALVVIGLAPSFEMSAGLGALVVLAGLAVLQRGLDGGRPAVAVVAWIVLAGCLAAGVVLAGAILAAAIVVALLVHLMPVPPLGRALPPVLAVCAGLGLAAWAQAGPAQGRPWLPDTAPARSFAALLGARLPDPGEQALDPDRREIQVLEALAESMGDLPLGEGARRATDRLTVDALGPQRFAAPPSSVADDLLLPVGLLDLFVRGGLVIFALATLSMWPRGGRSAWPRAGVAAGFACWVVLSALCATSPFALAAADLALLSAAGAGVAGAARPRSGVALLAFSVGGVVFIGLGLIPHLGARQASAWPRTLGNETRPGAALVGVLADGARPPGERHQFASALLADPHAPMLRLPEAALAHAQEALGAAPRDALALRTVVSAAIENLRFDEAVALARTFLDTAGHPLPEARVMERTAEAARQRWIAEGGGGVR